jgi:hypothetical protein
MGTSIVVRPLLFLARVSCNQISRLLVILLGELPQPVNGLYITDAAREAPHYGCSLATSVCCAWGHLANPGGKLRRERIETLSRQAPKGFRRYPSNTVRF